MQPQGCKACLFPVEDMLLEEIQFWIQQWSNNLCSIPHAIHEDSQGRLDLVNLDVWLWNRAIAPIKQEDLFKQVLWRNIFLVIGRWEELVGKTDWQKPWWTRSASVPLAYSGTGPMTRHKRLSTQ